MKPANLFICLSLLFLATAGCHGYAFIETPTTDGFHSKLPSPYTRAVVWGGRPDTVQSASTWLLKKGVLVVDQTKVLQAAADQKVSLTGYQYLETDVLRMAKLVGARLVVFSNAEVGSWEALDWSSGFPHSQRVYSATVALRAVDVIPAKSNGAARLNRPNASAISRKGSASSPVMPSQRPGVCAILALSRRRAFARLGPAS